MAFNLLINRISNQFLVPNQLFLFDSSVLWKRMICKSPGQSQRGKKRKPKNIKLICIPGQRVNERCVLGKQKALRYHPGINVALDPRDKSLYSLCSGTVYYSIEKFNPNPKSHFVQQFYANQIGPLYKKYIHVIADKNPIQFKLVDII